MAVTEEVAVEEEVKEEIPTLHLTHDAAGENLWKLAVTVSKCREALAGNL